MTLDEINKFIEELVKNEDFKELLNPNNNGEIKFALDITNKLLDGYSQIKVIENDFYNIDNFSIDCGKSDMIKEIIAKDFYSKLGISPEIIDEALNNTKVEQGLKRAVTRVEKNGEVEIHIGEFNGELGLLRSYIHEISHFIRKKAMVNGFEFGEIVEIASTFIDRIFYQYLVDNKMKLIDTKGNVRTLTHDDINMQRIIGMRDEKRHLHRVKNEFEVIKILKNNMLINGNYFFTKTQYENISNDEKKFFEPIVKELKKHYIDGEKEYNKSGNYVLKNGEHITNEFRFVIARLFTEYFEKDVSIQKNFGSYLMDGNIKSIDDVMKKYNVHSIDELINNQLDNYTKLAQNKLLQCISNNQDYNFNYRNYDISVVSAKVGDNFNIPYILAVPSNIRNLINENGEQTYEPTIVMESNNRETSVIHELLNNGLFTLEHLATTVQSDSSPLLVPILPSLGVNSPYFQQLSKECFEIDAKNQFYRIDEQVKNIINKVKIDIKNNYGVDISDKIFLNGYSSSGVFAERFSLLQPEIIDTVCIGGASGSIPIPTTVLNYPLGIGDYKSLCGKDFDMESYSKIKFNYYVGEYEMARLADNRYDELGSKAPMHDMSYFARSVPYDVGKTQRDLFGRNLLERSNKQIGILQSIGLDVDNQVIINGRGHSNYNDIKGVAEIGDLYVKKCYEDMLDKNKTKMVTKQQDNQKRLVYKNPNLNQNRNGFVDVLVLSLVTGFVSGFIFALTILLIK